MTANDLFQRPGSRGGGGGGCWGGGGGYLNQVLLGMCRWLLRSPTQL